MQWKFVFCRGHILTSSTLILFARSVVRKKRGAQGGVPVNAGFVAILSPRFVGIAQHTSEERRAVTEFGLVSVFVEGIISSSHEPNTPALIHLFPDDFLDSIGNSRPNCSVVRTD